MKTRKKARGRAPQKRDALIQVITTPEFRATLAAEAAEFGRTVSGHVRWILAHRSVVLASLTDQKA